MVAIDESNEHVTLINVFTVAPERRQELVEILNEATEKSMRRLPGFISASIHESVDAGRVVNYAQWATESDFKNMLANAEAKQHMERVNAFAKADPHLYRVARVHSRS
jgi:quinol monooxygenase YgiN